MLGTKCEIEDIGLCTERQIAGRQVGVFRPTEALAEVGIAYALLERCRVGAEPSEQRLKIVCAGHVFVAVTIYPLSGDDECDLVRLKRGDGCSGGAGTDEAAGEERARVAAAGDTAHTCRCALDEWPT